jgi:acyl carrier protein
MDAKAAVRDFIVNQLNYKEEAELTDDYPLIANNVIDSLGIFQTVTFLEEQFDIAIDDEELTPENFDTISAIAQLVESKR